MPEIQLSSGTLHYRDGGAGPPMVLIHGLLVDGRVWDPLLPALLPRSRCIVPDLPLGSHRRAMNPAAELTPPALAALITELIERLGLEDLTLIGNDTGGALCQMVVATRPERISRLVLTNCDAFEHFPPPRLRLAVKGLARFPGAVAALAAGGRLRPLRRAVVSLAPLTIDPIPDDLLQAWLLPLDDRAVRRDLVKVLRGIAPEHTLRAAERLTEFRRPVLIAWGAADRFFPFTDAERLAALFPDVRLQRIENARTFVQIDAPERLADLVTGFVSSQPTSNSSQEV